MPDAHIGSTLVVFTDPILVEDREDETLIWSLDSDAMAMAIAATKGSVELIPDIFGPVIRNGEEVPRAEITGAYRFSSKECGF